jgi:hypothetical protein
VAHLIHVHRGLDACEPNEDTGRHGARAIHEAHTLAANQPANHGVACLGLTKERSASGDERLGVEERG